jgi:thioredoxin-dependent peroxiredoxin
MRKSDATNSDGDLVRGQPGDCLQAGAQDFRLLSDPTKKTAEAYGVLNQGGIANRWTFYMGKDGRILAIDKTVKPATSAEDMAARLGELKVPTRP